MDERLKMFLPYLEYDSLSLMFPRWLQQLKTWNNIDCHDVFAALAEELLLFCETVCINVLHLSVMNSCCGGMVYCTAIMGAYVKSDSLGGGIGEGEPWLMIKWSHFCPCDLRACVCVGGWGVCFKKGMGWLSVHKSIHAGGGGHLLRNWAITFGQNSAETLTQLIYL